MKEARPLEYGMSDALDYIPGAEVLDNTEKLEQDKLEQGEWPGLFKLWFLISFGLCFFSCVKLKLEDNLNSSSSSSISSQVRRLRSYIRDYVPPCSIM